MALPWLAHSQLPRRKRGAKRHRARQAVPQAHREVQPRGATAMGARRWVRQPLVRWASRHPAARGLRRAAAKEQVLRLAQAPRARSHSSRQAKHLRQSPVALHASLAPPATRSKRAAHQQTLTTTAHQRAPPAHVDEVHKAMPSTALAEHREQRAGQATRAFAREVHKVAADQTLL